MYTNNNNVKIFCLNRRTRYILYSINSWDTFWYMYFLPSIYTKVISRGLPQKYILYLF